MSLSPLGAQPPRIATPIPVPDWYDEAGHTSNAYHASYEALPAFDTNRDRVVSREEFSSSHYDRLDVNGDGISRDELEAAFRAESPQQLWNLSFAMGAARIARERHQQRRLASGWTAGLTVAAAAGATALFGASAFVLAPAALLAGLAGLTWWGQFGKDRQVGQISQGLLKDVLEQKAIAWTEFDNLTAGQPFHMAEQALDLLWKVVSPVRKVFQWVKDVVEILIFFFGGI